MPTCACQHHRKDREIILDKETRHIFIRVTCVICNRWLTDEQLAIIATAA